jgi:retinol dehydrogenase-12
LESAREFQAKESKLDILVNNAGVMEPPSGSKSEDGYEMQWATNVLGPHAFTKALLPQLIEASKGKPAASVRIIWVSSAAVYPFCYQYLKHSGNKLMSSIGHTSPRNNH